MGLLDTLLGRTKPVAANLDQLFALPSAAVTLQAAAGLAPTGVGSVCVKSAEGAAFAGLEQQIEQLLGSETGGTFSRQDDEYGFTWLVRHGDPGDVAALVTDLHAANSTLAEAGFGPALLVTLVTFSDADGRRVGLVYRYKSGTWYPFVPTGAQQRDNARELQVRAALGGDLKVEPDLAKWFPVYGAPGL